VRASRDNEQVALTLSNLYVAANAGENIMESCIAAVKAYATVGEIVAELRKVYGKWIPTRAF
jgi:methylmalonyl-CoA mutase N-terminal domain/subunit